VQCGSQTTFLCCSVCPRPSSGVNASTAGGSKSSRRWVRTTERVFSRLSLSGPSRPIADEPAWRDARCRSTSTSVVTASRRHDVTMSWRHTASRRNNGAITSRLFRCQYHGHPRRRKMPFRILTKRISWTRANKKSLAWRRSFCSYRRWKCHFVVVVVGDRQSKASRRRHATLARWSRTQFVVSWCCWRRGFRVTGCCGGRCDGRDQHHISAASSNPSYQMFRARLTVGRKEIYTGHISRRMTLCIQLSQKLTAHSRLRHDCSQWRGRDSKGWECNLTEVCGQTFHIRVRDSPWRGLRY